MKERLHRHATCPEHTIRRFPEVIHLRVLRFGTRSDIEIQLARTGSVGPATLTLPAQSTSLVKIGTDNPDGPFDLAYEVTNFLVAPGEGLEVFVTVGE